MSDYRLEACSVCGSVRREIRSAITRQREREGIDRLEWYGGTPVYVIDFCPSCLRAWEAARSPEAPAVTQEGPLYDTTYGACHDCGRRYGDRFGFPDLLIADWAWERITPAPHPEGGLLCPSCIVRRCEAIGLKAVPATFASGPLVSITYEAFRALSTTAPAPVGEQAPVAPAVRGEEAPNGEIT